MSRDNLDKRLTIRLTPELEAALERAAAKRLSKNASVVREALHSYLMQEDPAYRAAHELAHESPTKKEG